MMKKLAAAQVVAPDLAAPTSRDDATRAADEVEQIPDEETTGYADEVGAILDEHEAERDDDMRETE